jgi:hypothetical protein
MSDPVFARSFNADDSTVVSFETVGDALGNVDIGVGVVGNRCGVHGESHDVSLGTTVAPEGTGVHGRGGITGVEGDGRSAGVRGFVNTASSPAIATGVLGDGFDHEIGVTGLSFAGNDRVTLGSAAGVIGASNADSQKDPRDPRKILGAGVVGLSLRSIPSKLDLPVWALPDPREQPIDGDGTGVWGASGGGRGVHGESRDEAGVFGESNSARGGVFQSTQQAQLHLVPKVVTTGQQRHMEETVISTAFPILPKEGIAGDLMATVDEDENVRLWFCVRTQAGGRPAGWAPVLLGPTFDAT